MKRSKQRRFRLLGILGNGGVGEVFRAFDVELKRIVALKQLRGEFTEDPDKKRRFRREARLAGKLEHPGIVPIHSLSNWTAGGDPTPYYAMRLVRGKTMSRAIRALHQIGDWRRGRFEGAGSEAAIRFRELLRRFLAVCETIHYAHDKRIVHCDLKPENVMLGKHGETIVIDWGMAQELQPAKSAEDDGQRSPDAAPALASQTMDGSIRGTPIYMAPEQVQGGAKQASLAGDIYSLGAILYCLIVGKPPFEWPPANGDSGPATADLAQRLGPIIQGRFPKPSEIKPEVNAVLEAICLKAMAFVPQDRYSSPKALSQDIERWLAGEPALAKPETPIERAQRFAKRHWRPIVLAAAILIAALGSWRLFEAGKQAELAERVAILGSSSTELAKVSELAEQLAPKIHDVRSSLQRRMRSTTDDELWMRLALPILLSDPEDSETAERFWRIANDPKIDGLARFVAACALAKREASAIGNRNWGALSKFLVRQLVEDGSEKNGARMAVKSWLKPVGPHLTKDLLFAYSNLSPDYRDENNQQRPDVRKAALNHLLEYASDAGQWECLAEAALQATPDEHALIIARIRSLGSQKPAIDVFRRALTDPSVDWIEMRPMSSWAEVSASDQQLLKSAEGFFGPDFAVCQSLPFESFGPLAQRLQDAGYHVLRFRPRPAENEPPGHQRVAAIWVRRALRQRFLLDQTQEELQNAHARNEKDEFRIVDVAAYPAPDGRSLRYGGFWIRYDIDHWCDWLRESPYDVRTEWFPSLDPHPFSLDVTGTLGLGLTDAQNRERNAQLVEDFHSGRTIQWTIGPNGERLWTRVWDKFPGSYHGNRPSEETAASVAARIARRGAPFDLCMARSDSELRHHLTWKSFSATEQAVLLEQSPSEHLQGSLNLTKQGYRPAAISAIDSPWRFSSVWVRPALKDFYWGVETRQANAAAALLALADSPSPDSSDPAGPEDEELAWGLLREPKDGDPSERTLFIHRLKGYGIEPRRLMNRLQAETDPYAIHGLIAALGSYHGQEPEKRPEAEIVRDALAYCREIGLRHPNSGVRSAAIWLIRRWDQNGPAVIAEELARTAETEEALLDPKRDGSKNWFTEKSGHSYAVFQPQGPVTLGYWSENQEHEQTKALYRVEFRRTFAISITETTSAQFQRFVAEMRRAGRLKLLTEANPPLHPKGAALSESNPQPDCPQVY